MFVWSTLLDLYWSCCILFVKFFFKQYINVFAFEIEAPHRAVLIFWTCIYESGFLGFTAWSCYFVALFICSERIVYSCLTLVTYDLFTQLYIGLEADMCISICGVWVILPFWLTVHGPRIIRAICRSGRENLMTNPLWVLNWEISSC